MVKFKLSPEFEKTTESLATVKSSFNQLKTNFFSTVNKQSPCYKRERMDEVKEIFKTLDESLNEFSEVLPILNLISDANLQCCLLTIDNELSKLSSLYYFLGQTAELEPLALGLNQLIEKSCDLQTAYDACYRVHCLPVMLNSFALRPELEEKVIANSLEALHADDAVPA